MRRPLAARFAIALAVGLVALVAPAGASAATTFGSDLTLAPSSSVGCTTFGLSAPCTTVLTGVHAGNAHAAAAPSSGVIVRVRVKTGGAETYTFRLARAATGGMTGGGGGPVLVTTAGSVSVFEVRVPVQAGDLLAADGSTTTAYNCSGGSNEIYSPTLTDGAAGRAPSRSNPCELLVNADIEADADTDGYGDETQDNCAGAANAGQENNDGDAEGDACDADDDNDTIADATDACPLVSDAARPREPRNGCPAPAPTGGGNGGGGGAGGGTGSGGSGGTGDVLGDRLSVAEIRSALRADLAAALRRARRRGLGRLLSSGGFTLGDVDALTAGTLSVTVTGPAGRAGASAKPIVYAKGRKTFARAGKGKVRVKLTKKGRKRLRRARRARLKVTATFSAKGLAKTTAKRTLRLKRKRKMR